MKKIIKMYKSGTLYQIGALSTDEVEQIKTDIEKNASDLSDFVQTSEANLNSLREEVSTSLDVFWGWVDDTITSAISSIDKEIFEFVDTLPTENIKTNKIYVTATEGATGVSNSYTEWWYKDGNWEKVGEFKSDTDLSNLYTKDEVDTAISNAVNGLDKTWYGTQEMYDSLETTDPTTEYRIYIETTD